MKKKEENLLNESFEFIGANLDALSNEIPKHLIDFWEVGGETIELDLQSSQTTNQGSVFMYALIQQKTAMGLNELEIETEKLAKMYQNWQLMLTAISVSNLSDIKFKPFFETKEFLFE